MKKTELVTKLKNFVANPTGNGCPADRMVLAFAGFLIHFLQELDTSYHDKWDFTDLTSYLPRIFVDAFEALRTGEDEVAVSFRKQYERASESRVPNLCEIGEDNLVERGLAVEYLAHFTADLTGHDYMCTAVREYCNAQSTAAKQTFDKFIRLVYRKGLYTIISDCRRRGMSGKFGKTDLRTFTTAGRLMFTFARKIDERKDSYYKMGGQTYRNEWSVSFVAIDDDPLCLGAGLQSAYCSLAIFQEMIEEVIKNWPSDPEQQKIIYQESESVTLG